MARRNGRPSDYLCIDEYTGFSTYRSQLSRDFWGAWARKPLQRNLQDICTPLPDPYPVDVYTGSAYENTQNDTCQFERIPLFIGVTNIPTPRTSPAAQAIYPIGIGQMSVGCTFQVA